MLDRGAWDLSPDGRLIGEDIITIHSLADHRISTITIKDWNELEDVTWQSTGMGLFASTHRGQNSTLLSIDLQGQAFVLWENRGAHRIYAVPSPDGQRIVFGQVLNQHVDDEELLSLMSNPWLRYWLARLQ